jgi:hypothetical protein
VSDDSPPSDTRVAVGPVRLVWTSLGAQSVGLLLLLVASAVLGWAADPAVPLVPTVLHALLGGLVLFAGLYLGGFRFR